MKEIPLTRGFVALVDDEDFEWLNQWKWYALITRQERFYAARWVTNHETKVRRLLLMHRVITEAGEGKVVDHADGNSLDNRRSNIRVCTQQQNVFNRGPQRGAKYKGVTAVRGGKAWAAGIADGKRRVHLGTYTTPEAAACAYDVEAKKRRGEFAMLNNVAPGDGVRLWGLQKKNRERALSSSKRQQ